MRIDRPPTTRSRAAWLALVLIIIDQFGQRGRRLRLLVEEDLIGGVEQVLALTLLLSHLHCDVKA